MKSIKSIAIAVSSLFVLPAGMVQAARQLRERHAS